MENIPQNVVRLQKTGLSQEKSLVGSLLAYVLIPFIVYIGGAIYNSIAVEGKQKKLYEKQKKLAKRKQIIADKGYQKSSSLLEKLNIQLQKYAIKSIENINENSLKVELNLINKYFEFYFNLKKTMLFYDFIKKEFELWTLGYHDDDSNQSPVLDNIRISCIFDLSKYSKTHNYTSLGNYFIENNP